MRRILISFCLACVLILAAPGQDRKLLLGVGMPTLVPPSDISGATFVDNPDAGYSLVGSNWTTGYTGIPVGYGGAYDYKGAGSGTETATWNVSGLTAGQAYWVFTCWREHSSRATNAPYTVTGGASPLTVAVNQQNAPNGPSHGGITWQALGRVTLTGTTLSVQLADNANGFVIADAVAVIQ
jgi:hypothetical protein